jgi:serine/threonine-protein kinase
MLYQFLSGKLPFDSKAAGELIVMHITEPPPPLLSLASDLEPALAPALAQVVERLLLKAAPARPTMTEVSQQLQALSRQLAGLSSGSLPVVSPVGATPEVTSMLAPAALPVPSGPQTAPLPLLRESEGAPAGAAVAEHTSDAALRAAGNSTLGQTVGQLRPAPWARRRSLFLVPAALLLVSGVGIGYRSLSSADRRLGSPAVAAADPSPGATTAVGNPPARKRCQLISEPAGASVLRDGKELGKTPLTVDFPSPGSPLLVELRLSGFVTMGLELRPQDGESRLVHLSAENRPPLPRPSSPKKKEKPKGGKSLFDSID